jgi:hypothetical protein
MDEEEKDDRYRWQWRAQRERRGRQAGMREREREREREEDSAEREEEELMSRGMVRLASSNRWEEQEEERGCVYAMPARLLVRCSSVEDDESILDGLVGSVDVDPRRRRRAAGPARRGRAARPARRARARRRVVAVVQLGQPGELELVAASSRSCSSASPTRSCSSASPARSSSSPRRRVVARCCTSRHTLGGTCHLVVVVVWCGVIWYLVYTSYEVSALCCCRAAMVPCTCARGLANRAPSRPRDLL